MPTLAILLGATNYAFETVGEIPARVKSQVGELQRLTGKTLREDILFAPWSISSWGGLGLAIATLDAPNPDNRLYSEENVWTVHPGIACLGPLKSLGTYPAGVTTLRPKGITHAIGELFLWGTNSTSADTAQEAILYFDSTNWLDSTAHVDATGTGDMDVRGMCEHVGRAYAVFNPGLMDNGVGGNTVLVMRSDAGSATVWNVINHATSASPLRIGVASEVHTFVISDGTNLFATSYLATTDALVIRKSTDDGTAWASRQTLRSPNRPRGMALWEDGATGRSLDPWVSTSEGLYWCDDSANTFSKMVPFLHPESAYTGTMPTDGATPFGLLASDGPDLLLVSWGERGELVAKVLFSATALPPLKRGDITAIAFVPGVNWVLFAVGGQTSTTNAGLYIYKLAEGTTHNVYYNATANRVIYACAFTTETDGVPKFLIAEDNGVANDTAAYRFLNVTYNPRTVASYAHAATGEIVLPTNSRYLRELLGIWNRVEGFGTNFSTARTVTAYKSADAAPIDTDGTWTQLDDLAGVDDVIDGTTTSVYFPETFGTPLAIGDSARSMQLRLKFDGASNASPYLETLNTYVEKVLPVKYIRSWIIDIDQCANGSIRPRALIISDLEAIVAATLQLVVTSSERAAVMMRPYLLGDGPLEYRDKPFRPGSIQDQMDVRFAVVTLEDV